ncbi:predicted protein [Naegleria gruberi]|uniref:Predicted protein n=1 Tax=Naegleria gruberi TaxID=5762 RepID=D2VMB9_NAEGR|nr:uncharacterized protein NAEGRDRAFT_70079 [Naegleria gruberi]EFC42036.1 predicted protein [Naegleria gruberi]|eukprot:XP_002674780.1 predicted protein [Naegleria gruberi strain NEG-M]
MKEKNFFSVLWTIVDHEGVSGLMKGSLVRVFDTLSTTFLTSTIRPSIETALGQSSNLIEPSCIVTSSILLYPLRILVRRLQSQTALDEKQSPLAKFSLILKKEGPSSFYSGFPFFILLTFIHHLTQLSIQNTLQ